MDAVTVHRMASEQADTMRQQGRHPQIVELGRAEIAALQESGITGDAFEVQVSEGDNPGFRAPGTLFPSSGAVRLPLRIKRVDADTALRVTDDARPALTAAELAAMERERRWTPEQCRALYAARQRGVTHRALAQAHGVSTERIRYLAAKGQRLEATSPARALD